MLHSNPKDHHKLEQSLGIFSKRKFENVNPHPGGAFPSHTDSSGKGQTRKVGRGGVGFKGAESPCFVWYTFEGSGQACWDIWSSEVEEKGGKNQEDEYSIISDTKERSKKKPGCGHRRLARRPPAGLMKHLWCRTIANATKKMCLGSADVPGPPEQNNDIITISVTDQTVHKVTGRGL